ncbi:MAG: sulfatase, partial [Acidobacteriota bacterium]
LRFIEDPSPPVFEPAVLFGEPAVRTWGFRGTPPGRFQLREISASRGDGVAWWLMPEAQRVVIQLDDAGLAAEEIETVRVTAESRRLGGATLHWGPAGEPLEPSRHLALPFSGRGRETFRFAVGGHPEWRGEVGRLMLTLFTPTGSEVGLVSLDAVGRPAASPPPEVAEQPWRVELDSEVDGELGDDDFSDRRLALVGWPGTAHRRQLTVPPDARWRMGFGVWKAAPHVEAGPVRFRAIVEGATAKGPGGAAADGPPVGESIAAEAVWRNGDAGFRDLDVDLSDYAGERVTLRLEAVDEHPRPDPRRALPLWAHPEVTAPADGAVDGATDGPLPDVVMIVLDTLRADRLSLYGHERATSPHLDAWARRHGAVFESAVSSAGWTLPAHTSLFSGVDAPRHGANWPSSRVGDDVPLLAERLYRLGYRTEAITGGGYLDPNFGLDRGFERYRTWPRGRGEHAAEPTRTLGAAVERLERHRDGPLFLFVHTYAVHAPYAPWQPFFGRFSERPSLIEIRLRPPRPGDYPAVHRLELRRRGRVLSAENAGLSASAVQDLVESQYDAGVARLDGLLRPLLEASTARDRLVVVTSDHGEMLGEAGYWEHGHVFDPTLKVPLIVAAPGGLGSGRRIPEQVRGVDVAPTVLDLLGVDGSEAMDGRTLMPLLRGEPDVPRPAWSYGSRTFDGLALRLRDRTKLVLHDDVLAAEPGGVSAFEVGRSPREEREVEPPASLDPLIEEARMLLLAELPGLHLSFSNRGSRELRFDVDSGAAVADRVKTPDAICRDCVRWRPPVGLEVKVPPGEVFTVVLGDVRDSRLQMTLLRADGGRQRLTLDLTEHDRPLSMAVVDGRFEVTAGPPPDVGVGVRFVGPTVQGADPLLDPETAAALRALGYIE